NPFVAITPGVLKLDKRLEHGVPLILGYPYATVDDIDPHAICEAHDADNDRRPVALGRIAVLDGVGYQIAQHTIEEVRVAADEHVFSTASAHAKLDTAG